MSHRSYVNGSGSNRLVALALGDTGSIAELQDSAFAEGSLTGMQKRQVRQLRKAFRSVR